MSTTRSCVGIGFRAARRIERLGAALALCACAACASFSESRLPKRDLADLVRDGKLVEVTYQISEGTSIGSVEAMNLEMALTPTGSALRARVEPIFRRAFVEATLQHEPGEWHIDMYYRETARNPAITYTFAVIFVCSLGIVPAYLQDDLYLEAKLRHNGETVRQLVYEDSIGTWLHWFVLPWSIADDPIERKATILDNMVLNLLFELKGDLGVVAGT